MRRKSKVLIITPLSPFTDRATDKDPKFNFHNWNCKYDDAKDALRKIIEDNSSMDPSKEKYIGHVVPIFDLHGTPILPDDFSSLPGTVVQVAATISHEVLTERDRSKSENFYADVSYIIVLKTAPLLLDSPSRKRGVGVAPHHLSK